MPKPWSEEQLKKSLRKMEEDETKGILRITTRDEESALHYWGLTHDDVSSIENRGYYHDGDYNFTIHVKPERLSKISNPSKRKAPLRRANGEAIVLDKAGVPNECSVCGRHYCDH